MRTAEKGPDGSRIPTKKAWWCPACGNRQYPFKRGKSMIADIKEPDTGKWTTIVTNPPPAPITAAVALLKYESYKSLIEEWGDEARKYLPKVQQIGEKTRSVHDTTGVVRAVDFAATEEWSETDWWVVAGLAVGWTPEMARQ
ncbi:MAG: hypothetical protein GY772_27915 [bacterium]|nr:hypothetical protein [bacterium]